MRGRKRGAIVTSVPVLRIAELQGSTGARDNSGFVNDDLGRRGMNPIQPSFEFKEAKRRKRMQETNTPRLRRGP